MLLYWPLWVFLILYGIGGVGMKMFENRWNKRHPNRRFR